MPLCGFCGRPTSKISVWGKVASQSYFCLQCGTRQTTNHKRVYRGTTSNDGDRGCLADAIRGGERGAQIDVARGVRPYNEFASRHESCAVAWQSLGLTMWGETRKGLNCT